MKRFLLLAVLAAVSTFTFAQSELRFDANGEFKIVQFTDIHFDAHNRASIIALKRMHEVIEAERPDLVVITGDIVYSRPAETALRRVVYEVAVHDVPFCVMFGNHDPDFGVGNGELYDIARTYDGCVMPERDGVESPDYVVEIKASRSDSPAAYLYCIDSNSHIYDENDRFVAYDCIHEAQVEWYKSQSSMRTAANDGTPVPSVAFFHIPLPEYAEAVKQDGSVFIGTKRENVCAPGRNSGMFTAIKEMGDVFATFVGHDHDNDYLTMYDNILLGYGRYTGGNTEYNNLPNGARVIILKEGRNSLETYVRLKGGEIKDRATFPDCFTSTPWRGRPLDPECL